MFKKHTNTRIDEVYLVITLAAWSWTNLHFPNAFETLHAALELKSKPCHFNDHSELIAIVGL